MANFDDFFDAPKFDFDEERKSFIENLDMLKAMTVQEQTLYKKYKEVNYVHEKMEGLYQKWHENGKKYIVVNYINDKKEGLYQEWHNNGKIALEVNYINNKIEGLYKKLDKYGNLEIIVIVIIIEVSNYEFISNDY